MTDSSTASTGRRRGLTGLVVGLAALVLAGCVGVPAGVTPVTGFDVDRYQGNWYEIARLDHRFERGLSNVTANYSLNEDGSVRVLNRGFNDATCTYEDREGRATFLGSPDVASLGVSFFANFQGGYHVIELEPNYRYAVVSGPDKSYFWILARDPQMNQATLSRIIAEAGANGYPIDELIMVDQSGPTC